MARVKKGTNANKTRKNVLKQVKGYRFGRSTKERLAYEAISHAGTHAFRDRRDKKNVARRTWTLKINAALDEKGISYSKFIKMLSDKSIEIDRKILAELAENEPKAFDAVIAEATK